MMMNFTREYVLFGAMIAAHGLCAQTVSIKNVGAPCLVGATTYLFGEGATVTESEARTALDTTKCSLLDSVSFFIVGFSAQDLARKSPSSWSTAPAAFHEKRSKALGFIPAFRSTLGALPPQETAASTGSVESETLAGTLDGANLSFSTVQIPKSGTLVVARNGLVMTRGVDYTLQGKVVTFVSGQTPKPGDQLTAWYRY